MAVHQIIEHHHIFVVRAQPLDCHAAVVSRANSQDPALMREMFDTIAPRYDFISRVLSFGMDGRWKRLGVAKASLPENAGVLELACGTGDFSQLVLERLPHSTPVATDIT